MSVIEHTREHYLNQDEAIDPVLEELGSILLDCLRLNRASVKATAHILDAINVRVLEMGMSQRLPPRTDQSLQPWQEILATGLFARPFERSDDHPGDCRRLWCDDDAVFLARSRRNSGSHHNNGALPPPLNAPKRLCVKRHFP